MGNRFGRKRDTPANGAETAAADQKEETAAPTQDPVTAQEAVGTENVDVVVGEQVAQVPSLPCEECVSECKEVSAPPEPAPVDDTQPEPEETLALAPAPAPATATATPLVSVSEPSPPEPEPKPVAEVAAEPVPEPEPTSNPEAEEVEAVPDSISESAAAPEAALEQQTDTITQEPLPETLISSPALIDVDATSQPINVPPSPAPTPAPENADEPAELPATEECPDGAEVSAISTLEPEKSDETPAEVEVAGNEEQLVSDVSVENVSGLLQNLELKGNDLVADLSPADVKIPDDTPITDTTSTSTELM